MNRFQTPVVTLIKTGANEMTVGARTAMRGMIWTAYAYHLDCVMGDASPADFKAKVAAELFDQFKATPYMVQGESQDATDLRNRVKGGVSTKSAQAVKIGAAFSKLFASELGSDYASVADFVQACYTAAVASGADAILRLVDWAVHGNPHHAAEIKAEKAAEKASEKAQAQEAQLKAAQQATALNSLPLDAVAKVAKVQNLNLETEIAENTIAAQVATMSDAELDALSTIINAERAERMQSAEAVAA